MQEKQSQKLRILDLTQTQNCRFKILTLNFTQIRSFKFISIIAIINPIEENYAFDEVNLKNVKSDNKGY